MFDYDRAKVIKKFIYPQKHIFIHNSYIIQKNLSKFVEHFVSTLKTLRFWQQKLKCFQLDIL